MSRRKSAPISARATTACQADALAPRGDTIGHDPGNRCLAARGVHRELSTSSWRRCRRKTRTRCALAEEDLVLACHFGLGMAIRNQLGLWGDNKMLLRACAQEHARETQRRNELPLPEELGEVYELLLGADGASSVIVRALWRRFREDSSG